MTTETLDEMLLKDEKYQKSLKKRKRLLFLTWLPKLLLFWLGFGFIYFYYGIGNFFLNLFGSIGNSVLPNNLFFGFSLFFVYIIFSASLITYPIYLVWKRIRVNDQTGLPQTDEEKKKILGIDDESGVVDKSDIRYWHGLMKDGIISEDEFEKKKSELI